MDMESYIDGIHSLLTKAGIEEAEIAQKGFTTMASHCFQKGVSFERAATSILKKFDVEIAA